jgi:hypothetical protein
LFGSSLGQWQDANDIVGADPGFSGVRAALRLALGLLALALLSTLGASRTSGREPPSAPPAVTRATVARWTCPAEMVDIAGRFCVDRWEVSLIEPKSGRVF